MNRTRIVASECAAGLHPANTLTGFRSCLDHGVDGIEFDIHLSSDDHAVIQHDYRLNPNTTRDIDGKWLERPTACIVETPLDRLRKYQVGRYRPHSREAKTYRDYRPSETEPIPTLDEFLTAVRESPTSNAQLWIELKTSPFNREISSEPTRLLEVVLSKLDDFGCTNRSVLLAFEWEILVRAKEIDPSIQTDFLTLAAGHLRTLHPKIVDLDENLLFGRHRPETQGNLRDAIARAGGDWWGPMIGDIDRDDVELAHSKGLRVNAWGIGSTPAEIDAAFALGLDAMTIARPDLAAARRKSSGGIGPRL